MAEGLWDDFAEPVVYIRYKGVWDMQDLYESIAEWFRRRKYKFHERVYKHKHPSPFGVERQYIWQAERYETEYVKIHYDIYIHTYDAHDVEVAMPDGSRKTFTKGRIWIEIKANLVSDWEKRFDESLFLTHLKSFYNKYIIKKNFTMGWGPKLRYEMYDLHAMIKRKLKMESEEYEHRYFSGVYRKY